MPKQLDLKKDIRRQRFEFEELEPRLLFSADPISGGLAVLDPQLNPAAAAPMVSMAQAAPSQVTRPHEIAFVDEGVDDAAQIVSDLQQQGAQGRDITTVLIGIHEDGIDKITAELNDRHETFDAIHIISHGDASGLQLGNERLDQAALLQKLPGIAAWGQALNSGADLLLYGCDLASTGQGKALSTELAMLTGGDVAASVDLTGSSLLGGDWTLEYETGQIQAANAASATLQAQWQHVLATTTFQEGVSSYTGTQDTYIQAGNANSSAGGTANQLVGGKTTVNQTLVRFDNIIGSGAGQIPQGSTITSATLTLTVYGTDPGESYELHRILINWSEASTWNTLTSGIATDGTDASSTVDTTFANGSSTLNLSSANITSTVQAWASGGNNYGWMIKGVAANATNSGWDSSEFSTAASRPKLSVTYTPPTPPSIDLDANNSSGATGSNFSAAFTEQTAINVADTDASVTAGANSTLTGMTATLSNPLDGAAESLVATTTGTSITATYASGTGILSLSGSDTAAHYQQVLRTVQYNNSSDNPSTTSRTIQVVATDAYGSVSSTATTTLSVTRVNDAPVITSGGGGTSATASMPETLTAATTVTASDLDGNTLSYTITGGADAAKFSINSSTGALKFVTAPNFEAPTDAGANNIYDVTVQVSDGTLTDSQAIAVTVTDVSSALVVTTTADTDDSGLAAGYTTEQLNAVNGGADGKVSLREAITASNNTAGANSITFSIASGSAGTGSDAGAYIITTTSALPTITDAVSIDASTQSGYVAGGLHTVVLDGNDAAAYGLQLSSASDGSTIRGLVIRNFTSYGVYLPAGSDNQTLVGNDIGSFYADGSNAGVGKGNTTAGIFNLGANATIGGTTTADRNVISGNSGAYNIYTGAGSNGSVIKGNYIGTNAAGTAVFTSTNPDYGISAESSATNITIGGAATGAGNVVSGHNREGIVVLASGAVTIQGNEIGTDYTGTVDLGNTRFGINLQGSGTATIGGTTSGAGNVISGNNLGGIYAYNAGVVVQGNTIGLNATGTATLGNTGSGIILGATSASTIGGNIASARNVISGNSQSGIDIETTYAHVIKGNYIGLAADGATLLGNTSHGIYVNAGGSTIGGKSTGDGNIIAGNSGNGIAVVTGTGTLYYRNSIYSNTGLGIDLGNDGVTVNDFGDGDGGANYLNNYAVISSAVVNGSSTTITGSIEGFAHSTADTAYIELFSSPSLDPSGYGEGKTYLGAASVTTDPSTGDATFSITVTGVSVGDYITAVANVETSNIGASEFSPGLAATSMLNAPKGKLIWTDNDQFDSFVANWTGSAFTAPGATGLYLGDDVTMMTAAESPKRDEFVMIGSADVSGKIEAIVWNGSGWTAPLGIPVATPSAAASQYDSFAVAYESQSGNAMLVWDNGSTGSTGLSYATWNGTSWSALNTITAPATGEPMHMKLASNPITNGMVLVATTNTGDNNYAMVWNGSSWGSAQTLGTNSNKQYFEINVAYEAKSGHALVVYDNTGSTQSDLQYRIWNGTNWGTEQTLTAAATITATSDIYSTAIATDPTSNHIAVAVKNAANELWLSVWDGSTWGSKQVATTSGLDVPDHHATMALAFESTSGDLLAAYGKAAGPNVYYRSWTSGGGWSAESAGPSMGGTDIIYALKLYADPYSNTVMLGVQDGGYDLNFTAWDGASWGSTTTLDTNTVEYYRENFAFAWNVFGTPTISALAADTLTYAEDSPAAVIDQGTSATVSDGDGIGYLGGNLTVSFAAGSTPSEDALAIRNQGAGVGQIGLSGATVTYAGTTIGTYTGGASGSALVITFNSLASDAAVGKLVNNITYVNTNTSNPSTSSRTARYVVTNARGLASTPTDATISVTAVNDVPVNSVPSAQAINEDTALTFSSANGNLISITDIDAASGNLQVTLGASHGTLSLSGITGLSFTAGDGSQDASMVFAGTLSSINAALAGLVYTPTANYSGTDTLTLLTSDLGNSGSGGALTDADSVTITMSAVNDAPVNTVPLAQTTNEDTALIFSSGNGNLMAITDVDAASGSMQVTLGVTNGTLTLSGTTGLTFTSGDGSLDASMVFTGTVANINTALSGLTYTPASNYSGADTLTLLTSDLGNTGSGGAKADSDSVAITITAANDAPVNTVPGAQTVNEDTALTFSSGNGNLIAISDVDAAPGSLQVMLGVAHGTLSLSSMAGLSFTSGDGTLDTSMIFTGTVTNINNALAGLAYTPTGNYTGADSLSIQTSDQGNTGSGGTKTDSDGVAITVSAVNDTPVNSVPAAQSTNEDAPLTFSSGNGNLVSIADVDAASGTLQVTLGVAHGTLTLSGTTGLTFTNGDGFLDASMVFTGTLANLNTALSSLVYASTADYNGADSLTILTSDQGNTGSGGAKTDSDTVAITVNPINDAPVNAMPGAQTTIEDTARTFSFANGNLISITDVDAASGDLQVTLGLSHGTLSLSGITGLVFTTGDGSIDASMVFTGTLANINSALSGLVYTPTTNYNGADNLTILTSDLANTGTGGAKTDSDSVAITVSAINDAPVNTVPGAQNTNEDTPKIFSSGNGNLIAVSDVDAASGAMQVTLGVLHGTLSLSGTTGLSFSTGDGTLDANMVFTGTQSNVNAALAGLAYTPTSNFNGADTLSLVSSDQGNTGSGGAKADSDSVAITVDAVNDAPVNSVPGAQTLNEDVSLTFTTANGNVVSIADVDAASGSLQLILSVAHGALSLSGTTGLSFTSGDGTLDAAMTLTGTLSNLNAALLGMVYTPTPDYAGADTLTIQSSDQNNTGTGGPMTDTDAVSLTVSAINDAPINSVPGVQTINEDSTLTLNSGNGNLISISDVDAGSGTMRVTLGVSHGTFSLSGTTGLSFATGDGTQDANMVVTGSVSNINAALSGLLYTPTGNYNGSDALTVLTSDLGNTGSGGAKTDSDSITVNITAVDDPPVAGGDTASTDPAVAIDVAVKANDSDPDNTVASLTITIVSNSAGTTATVNPNGTIHFDPGATSGAQTVVYHLTDGNGLSSADATLTVNVNLIPNAPPTGSDLSASFDEDTGYTLLASDFGFHDADSGPNLGAVRIESIPLAGSLKLNGAAVSVSDVVSAADIQAGALVFSPAANGNGSAYATFTFKVQDIQGAFSIFPNTFTFNVDAVNDAPALTRPGAQAVDEDSALVFSSGNGNLISITDVDAASSTLEVTLGVSHGNLTLAGITGLSFTSGDGAADAAMVFTGTLTDINQALAGLSYAATPDYNGQDTLTLLTSDLGHTGPPGPPNTLTDSDSVNITVSAVNDVPVNTLPVAQTTDEDTALVFSSANGNLIAISDVDAAGGALQLTLTVMHGTLSLSGTTGLSFTTGDGSLDASLVFTGTLSDINSALNGLSYTANADYNGADALSLLTSDQGNTGSGGAGTDSDSIAITVNPVNDAPVNAVPGAQAIPEDTALVFSSGSGNPISISDMDASPGNLRVTLGVSHGTLTLAATSGLTFTQGDGLADSAMSFAGSLTDLNNALTGLSYTGLADYNGADNLTILSLDQGNTGLGGPLTDTDSVPITVSAVNDAPVNTVPAAQSTNEDTPLVFSAAHGNLLAVSDVDLSGGSLQITLAVAHGTLSLADTTGLTFLSGDGMADASMVLTGTQADINAALSDLTYTPTNNENGADTLTVLTSDLGNTGTGGALTDSDSVGITVTAIDDAPVNALPGAQSISEDNTLTFSAGHNNLITLSDVDAASGSLQVTLGVSHGSLSLSGSNGLSFSAGSGLADTSMVFTGTLADINAALDGLIYQPDGQFNGADTLTIITSDQGSSGLGGPLTDTDSVAITVSAVNDAPVNAVPAPQSTSEDTPLRFSVANSNPISVADGDVGGGHAQVTLSVLHGSLSLSGTTGLSFTTGDGTADASMVLTGTQADINAALSDLIYTPAANEHGSDTLTVLTSDLGNTGSGGLQTDTDTVDILITSVNDAPINATPNPQAVDEDTSLVFSAGNGNLISITDVDAASGDLEVTLGVSHGAMTLAGITGLSFTLGDGAMDAAMVFTGTLTDINHALEGLIYTGRTNYNGQDTLTLLTSDLGHAGPPGPLTDADSVTITINPINDAPANLVPGSQTVNEDAALIFSTGSGNTISISDADAASSSLQVTLGASHGTLTLAGITGLTFIQGDGASDSAMVFAGSITDLNSALAGLSYTGAANYNGTDTLTMLTTDQGSTGLGGPLTDTDSVAITVSAINDAPTALDDTASAQVSTPIDVAVKANDQDPDNALASLTITIVSSSPGTLATVNPDGTIHFDPGATSGSQSVVYFLTDAGGLSSANARLVIDVVANTPPTGSDGSTTIEEDTSYTLQASDFGFADADSGQTFNGIRIQAAPGLGTLLLNGVNVSALDVISSAEISAGHLVYAPAANGEGLSYDSFSFRVQDNLGAFAASANAFTVDITPVNDAPIVNAPGTQRVNEDGTLVFGASHGNMISIADLDAGTGELQVSVEVSHGALSISSTTGLAFTAGDGSDDTVMSFTGTATNINAALSGLTYSPSADYNGPDALTLQTSDLGNTGTGGAQTRSDIVNINVVAVNDPPAITTSDHLSAIGFEPIVTTMEAQDPDGPWPLTFQITGGADSAMFSLDQATGQLRFKAPPDERSPLDVNRDNLYEVQIEVSDGSLRQSKSLLIRVSNAPSSPLPLPITNTTRVEVVEPRPQSTDSASQSPTNSQDKSTSPSAAPNSNPTTSAPPEALGSNSTGIIEWANAKDQSWALLRPGSYLATNASADLRSPQVIRPPYEPPELLGLRDIAIPAVDPFALPGLHALLASVDPTVSRSLVSPALISDQTANEVTLRGRVSEVGWLSLSLGSVWWASRAGSILTSLLASTPVWRAIDPLPIFFGKGDGEDDDDNLQTEEDQRAEALFEPHHQEEAASRVIQ